MSKWSCISFLPTELSRSGCRIVYIELAFDHIRNGLFRACSRNVKLANERCFTTKATYLVIPVNLTLEMDHLVVLFCCYLRCIGWWRFGLPARSACRACGRNTPVLKENCKNWHIADRRCQGGGSTLKWQRWKVQLFRFRQMHVCRLSREARLRRIHFRN